MKLFGMQMLGNKGAFEFLWWMGPCIVLNKATSHPLLFYHCEPNANGKKQWWF